MAAQDLIVRLKFGGGIHSRASEDEIDPREAHAGQNFLLDLENRELRPRPPFDLIATAPNAQPIKGFITLYKTDGTAKMAVQAGDSVYSFDGVSFGSKLMTVNSGASLRGPLSANWLLTDKALVYDLDGIEPIKEFDGTTLSNVSHNLTGTFIARHCFVDNERAFYADVVSNGTATRHMMVASKRGDYTNLSVADRPSSALSAADPFFLLAPDFRPINGLLSAFGRVVISSERGNIYQLTGSDATNYAIDELYPGSGADGDEAIAYVGNDVVYGRQGVIESLVATQNFGDVETADLSVPIQNSIDGFKDWTVVYNSRLQRVYFVPSGKSQIWVFNKSLVGSNLSPWTKWVTAHESAFAPTAIMSCIDPQDNLEYVFWGDSSGRLYRMEGSGSGDAGAASIKTEFLSNLIRVPDGAHAYDIEGWLTHRSGEAATVDLQFEYAGESVTNETVTISLPALSGGSYYGSGSYYGGGSHYGRAFEDRLARRKFAVAGGSSEFQIRVSVTGTTDFQINEIGLKFRAA